MTVREASVCDWLKADKSRSKPLSVTTFPTNKKSTGMELLLLGESAAQPKQLEKEIESFSERTTGYLAAYKAQITSEKERAIFERLVSRRGDYLHIRDRTLALINADQRETAIDQCKNQLFPAFKAYRRRTNFLRTKWNWADPARGDHGCLHRNADFGGGDRLLIFVAGFLIGVSR
jgi:hypothetical protein